jgi:hypothetical protein
VVERRVHDEDVGLAWSGVDPPTGKEFGLLGAAEADQCERRQATLVVESFRVLEGLGHRHPGASRGQQRVGPAGPAGRRSQQPLADVRGLGRGPAECGGEEQLLDVDRTQRHLRDRFRRCHIVDTNLVQTAVSVPNDKAFRVPELQYADDVGEPARNPVPDDDTVADITGTQA